MEIADDEGAQVTKEDDIMNESDAAALSTLNEERRTSINKLVIAMALLCSIQDLDFRNLAQEHMPDVRKDLSGKSNLNLADPRYSV